MTAGSNTQTTDREADHEADCEADHEADCEADREAFCEAVALPTKAIFYSYV